MARARSPRAMGNPALRQARYKRLLASGGKTNKGIQPSEQMFHALVRDMLKGDSRKEIRRRAGKTRVSIKEELMAIREPLGIPKELVPELVSLIIRFKIPMETIYRYPEARRKINSKISNEKLWLSFIQTLKSGRGNENY